MAEFTLGQLLDTAIGAPKTEPIDFEQLRNLLNGMLVHLGLRDLPVQESGEPLEGTPKIPSITSVFADIEQLKQRTEDNEKEIAEVRALCEELREEIKVIKEEQSHMAEEMQKMQDTTNFQDMLDSLRNELLDTIMDMLSRDGQDWQQGGTHTPLWEDRGLIVIGNEITLTERPRTPLSRHRDTAGSSPVSSRSKAGTHSRGKDILPSGVTRSPRVSFVARGTGLHDVGRIRGEETRMGISRGAAPPSPMTWGRGKNLLQGAVSSPRASFIRSDTGWNNTGQIKDKEIKQGISKGAAPPSSKVWSREKNLPPGITSSPQISVTKSDVGWSDVEQIEDEEIKISISKAEALPVPLDVPPEMDMDQIKDEEIKARVSKAVSLPSSLGVPSEMDMERIKDEEIKMRVSKGASLPSPLHGPSEMDMEQVKDEEIKMRVCKGASLPSPLHGPSEMDMEQIKDEETKRSLSKAPPHIQAKTLDGSATALGVHPGSPSSHMPIQPGLSVQGRSALQNVWIPSESVAGTRFPTAKEARAGGSSRMEPSWMEPSQMEPSWMEPSQMEPGMTVLKVSSHKYLPSDQPFTTPSPCSPPGSPVLSRRSPPGSPVLSRCSPPGSPVLSGLSPPSPGSPALPRRSDITSYTPPPSPGLTGHLPHLAKQDKEQGQRVPVVEGYSRRSPMYCGGRHTSVCPVQPMEPLLPDPSKPGAFDLVGRDGLIYRGRQSRAPMGSCVEGASYSRLQ